MFERLKTKWGVTGWGLFLILLTFACGGSLCGYLGKKLLNWFQLSSPLLNTVVYVVLVTLLWPVCVILLSLFTGQYPFFKKYLAKIAMKIFGRSKR